MSLSPEFSIGLLEKSLGLDFWSDQGLPEVFQTIGG